MTRAFALLVAVLALFALPVSAESQRSQAPYLGVVGKPTERLPLESTQVDVTIAGVIADVVVKQVYTNRGSEPIEALYVFPGSDRAALYALTMKVGDRLIRAKIRGKEQAREEYEQAKSAGKTASLLEQLDPGVFRMNVANVLPNDRIEVELKYTELLVPERGVYEFSFPNTLGSSRGQAQDTAVDEAIDYAFDIRTRIRAALPLQRVESPSHDVSVARPSANQADVVLGEAALQKAGASDYVLRYTLAGDAIQSGVLAFPEGDGGYFLLTAEPPAAPPAEMVVPREFVFVVDVSGSMIGEPLDAAKALLRKLFSVLRPIDRFNVILFSGGSKVMAPGGSPPANPALQSLALATIDAEAAGGGTDLVPALETAFALPPQRGMARSIVIVTDGEIPAGGQAFNLIRAALGDSNVFVFGVGPSVEKETIELLARAGAGEPFIVEELAKAPEVAERMRTYIDRPLLTHARLGLDGIDAYDLEPGNVPDLLAERPITVVGRYRGQPQGRFVIQGYSGTQPYEQAVAFSPGATSPDLSALRLLWARTRIQRLLDAQASSWYGSVGTDEANEEAITKLGLDHGLITPYTSFVAVDERVRTDAAATQVQQGAGSSAGEPAPPPMAYSSGTGDALGVLRTIARVAPTIARAPASQLKARHIDGFALTLAGDTWRDHAFREGMTILRVRRDSAAFDLLLALRPDVRNALALGERVLLVLGDVAVLVGPDGFSDFPDASLRRVLPARG